MFVMDIVSCVTIFRLYVKYSARLVLFPLTLTLSPGVPGARGQLPSLRYAPYRLLFDYCCLIRNRSLRYATFAAVIFHFSFLISSYLLSPVYCLLKQLIQIILQTFFQFLFNVSVLRTLDCALDGVTQNLFTLLLQLLACRLGITGQQ